MNAVWVRRLDVAGLIASVVTLLLMLVWAFPLLWSFVATVLPRETPLQFVRNYGQVLFESELGRWYINSIITSGGVTAIVLAISAACGYAISQLDFTGRKVLWFVILASFMIPIPAPATMDRTLRGFMMFLFFGIPKVGGLAGHER